jgi:hypothetical protein
MNEWFWYVDDSEIKLEKDQSDVILNHRVYQRRARKLCYPGFGSETENQQEN